jgi:hypothetical protein
MGVCFFSAGGFCLLIGQHVLFCVQRSDWGKLYNLLGMVPGFKSIATHNDIITRDLVSEILGGQ